MWEDVGMRAASTTNWPRQPDQLRQHLWLQIYAQQCRATIFEEC